MTFRQELHCIEERPLCRDLLLSLELIMKLYRQQLRICHLYQQQYGHEQLCSFYRFLDTVEMKMKLIIYKRSK